MYDSMSENPPKHKMAEVFALDLGKMLFIINIYTTFIIRWSSIVTNKLSFFLDNGAQNLFGQKTD